MVLERGEMNQIPLQDKGRDLILDGLLRVRRRSPDRRPDLLDVRVTGVAFGEMRREARRRAENRPS